MANLGLINAAELVTKIPLTTLAKIVEAMGYENPAHEMTRLLTLQQQLKSQLEENADTDLDRAEALYTLARDAYANEDEMQINVDPPDLPFDISESDDGTWVQAWVWVPADQIEDEVARLKAKRAEENKSRQAAADLADQEAALFGEQVNDFT